jgi:hypothetical protein
VIYLDASIVLARLLAEDRFPPDAFWARPLVSSRLLAYEVFVRVHARGSGLAGDARRLIDRVSLLELFPAVLARALEPFPLPVRTLDALHLATMVFLRTNDQSIEVTTYDRRLAESAMALGFPLAEP